MERPSESSLSHVMVGATGLTLKQKKNWGETFTRVESKGRYEICAPGGQVVGQVLEKERSFWGFLTRWFLKGRWPFCLQVVSERKVELPRSKCKMPSADCGPRRAAVFNVREAIRPIWGERPNSRARGGKMFHPWTFEIKDALNDQPMAKIEKLWSGLLEEAFTDADKFSLTFPANNPALSRLVLAAALLVDFCYFENKSR